MPDCILRESFDEWQELVPQQSIRWSEIHVQEPGDVPLLIALTQGTNRFPPHCPTRFLRHGCLQPTTYRFYRPSAAPGRQNPGSPDLDALPLRSKRPFDLFSRGLIGPRIEERLESLTGVVDLRVHNPSVGFRPNDRGWAAPAHDPPGRRRPQPRSSDGVPSSRAKWSGSSRCRVRASLRSMTTATCVESSAGVSHGPPHPAA